MDTKKCSTCEEEKPWSAFGTKRWVNKDGTVVVRPKSRCNVCRVACERPKTEAVQQRARERANTARRKRLDAMTPEERLVYAAKRSAWRKEWCRKNPGNVSLQKQRYRERHKDAIAEKKARDAASEHGRALDKARHDRYYSAHKEAINARTKAQRDRLEDAYVKSLITRGKFSSKLIPDSMVQARKWITQIKRELKEKRA